MKRSKADHDDVDGDHDLRAAQTLEQPSPPAKWPKKDETTCPPEFPLFSSLQLMESQGLATARDLIRIGPLAKAAGMSIKTVRFYSDENLIPVAERSASGYRLFDPAVAQELDLIRNLRKLDLPLSTIRDYLQAKREGYCRCEDLKNSLRKQKQLIQQQIHELKSLDQELSETMQSWVNCGGNTGRKNNF